MLASVAGAHGLSSCGSWALERRPNSCVSQGPLLRYSVESFWTKDRTPPMSPALAGGFFTPEPPGKPLFLKLIFIGIWLQSRNRNTDIREQMYGPQEMKREVG